MPGSSGRDVVVRLAAKGQRAPLKAQAVKAAPKAELKAEAKPARSLPPSNPRRRPDMELKIIAEKGTSGAGTLNAKDEVFARDFNEALVHQLVVAYQANARIGSRAQKDRGAVNHSPRSPGGRKAPGAHAPA